MLPVWPGTNNLKILPHGSTCRTSVFIILLSPGLKIWLQNTEKQQMLSYLSMPRMISCQSRTCLQYWVQFSGMILSKLQQAAGRASMTVRGAWASSSLFSVLKPSSIPPWLAFSGGQGYWKTIPAAFSCSDPSSSNSYTVLAYYKITGQPPYSSCTSSWEKHNFKMISLST